MAAELRLHHVGLQVIPSLYFVTSQRPGNEAAGIFRVPFTGLGSQETHTHLFTPA